MKPIFPALAALTLIVTSSARAASSSDLARLAEQFRAYCVGAESGHGERILDDVDLPKASVTEARHLAAAIQPDGSWADIDYKSADRSAWPAYAQLSRVLSLTLFVRRTQGTPEETARALDAAHRALGWWIRHDPKNPNWWFNQIGVPKIMGTIGILLDADLRPEERKYITGTVMPRAKVGAMTGQNKVWLAGNGLMDAVLTGDDALAQKAAGVIAEEILVTPEEGIQADWSFHQHGPQQQFGNYGRAFALDMTRWAVILRGTSFAFPEAKIDILRHYLLDGQNWVTWRGAMDISSCGRQLAPRSPVTKAAAISAIMRTMAVVDPARAADYDAFVKRNTDDAPNDLVGTRYFWRSDYLVHRTADLAVTLKMHSNRVIGGETVNDENVSGNHLADGALFIYRAGNEYTDIFPCWNWRMIPGTTSALDDSPLTWITHPAHEKDSKKKAAAAKAPESAVEKPTKDAINVPPKITAHAPKGTAFVGAVVDGLRACAAMDFERDLLHAHKAWFFDGDTIYCLGSAITSTESADVVTTLNQCLLHGPITIEQDGKTSTLNSTAEDFLTNPTTIEHDNLRYNFLTPAHVHLTASPTTGNWKSVFKTASTPKNDVTENLFTLSIDHGPHPTNTAYAYAILPATAPTPDAKILSDTPDLQAMQLHSGTVAIIFWTPGALTLSTHTISADAPCILLVDLTPGMPRIILADPTQLQKEIDITIDHQKRHLHLPTGPMAGSTISSP